MRKKKNIPRKTEVSVLDKDNKKSMLTVVLPPNALMAAILQIMI